MHEVNMSQKCDRLEIDRRSFHAFEAQGTRMLFDRASGATLELNEFTHDVFSLIESIGCADAGAKIAERFPEVPLDDLADAIGDMANAGMLRYEAVDHGAQAEYLESLWTHNPYRIQMLMAQGCNLGCRYCYAWRNGSNQMHTTMPWKIARQAVDYLVWRSGERPDLQITFFGGEPLLNFPVLVQVVEYCRALEPVLQKRFVFELCTNATLLDEKVVEFLVAHKFLLFISIDGWREMHNHNRPSMDGEDLYDLIVKNAQHAHLMYRKQGLSTPKVRANLTTKYTDYFRVGSHLEDLGFSNVDVGMIEPLPHADSSPSALTEDQADELQAEFEAKLTDGIAAVQSGVPLGPHLSKVMWNATEAPSKLPAAGVTCGVGRNTLVVDNKGGLYPCHRYEGMTAYKLGDVFTGLSREATLGYYRMLNGHATAHCVDCWLRDYCGGGCAWLLSQKNGHLAEPTHRECDRRRRSMELTLAARHKLRDAYPDRLASPQMLAGPFTGDSRDRGRQGRTMSLKVLP